MFCPILNNFEKAVITVTTDIGKIDVEAYFSNIEDSDCPVMIIGPRDKVKVYQNGTYDMVRDFAEKGMKIDVDCWEYRDYINYIEEMVAFEKEASKLNAFNWA